MNRKEIEITKDTPIGIVKVSDFFRRFAVANPTSETRRAYLEDEKNISYERQAQLIYDIYNNVRLLSVNGDKVLRVFKRDNDLFIPKKYKHFEYVVRKLYPDIYKKGKYETIKLRDLFLNIEMQNPKDFRKLDSFFIDKDIIKEDNYSVVQIKKRDIYEIVEKIGSDKKNEIIKRYEEHWRGYLPDILDFLVASKFLKDKKNARLAILANSNFGKTKLFEWLKMLNEASFMSYNDFKQGDGINDKDPTEYEDKLALVIDEANGFPRVLFPINRTMQIRPQRRASVEVEINAIVLLAYDGGSLNNTFIDPQIAKRLNVIDLRGEKTKDLGEVMSGFSNGEVENAMLEYLHEEISKRLEKYRKDGSDVERDKRASEVMKKVFKTQKAGKRDKLQDMPTFIDAVKEALKEIAEDPRTALSYDVYTNVWLPNTIETSKGVIFQRSSSYLDKILLDYDADFETELKHKKIKQVLKMLEIDIKVFKINGKTVRGALLKFHSNSDSDAKNDSTNENGESINKYRKISTQIIEKYIKEYKDILDNPLLHDAEVVTNAQRELKYLQDELRLRDIDKEE